MPELVDPERLADMTPEQAAIAIRPLFEDSPWLARRLAGRSFTSWDELLDAAAGLLDDASDVEKAQVLDSHPRLGTPPAELRGRSELSWKEQGGERSPGRDVSEKLSAANDRYEARFGFPFVDWVAGRPLAEMIPVIDSRLASDRPCELARGCRALVDIARDRLRKLQPGV